VPRAKVRQPRRFAMLLSRVSSQGADSDLPRVRRERRRARRGLRHGSGLERNAMTSVHIPEWMFCVWTLIVATVAYAAGRYYR